LVFLLIFVLIGITKNEEITAQNDGWQEISRIFIPDCMHDSGVSNLVMDSHDSNHMIILTFYGLFRENNDGGYNWNTIENESLLQCAGRHSEMLNTNVYYDGIYFYFNSWRAIIKTTDFSNFELVKQWPRHSIDSFWTDGKRMFVGIRSGVDSHSHCLFTSDDNGVTWENLSENLALARDSSQPYDFGVREIEFFNGILFVYVNSGGDFRSFDNGHTFLPFTELGRCPCFFRTDDYLFAQSISPSQLFQSKNSKDWKLISESVPVLLPRNFSHGLIRPGVAKIINDRFFIGSAQEGFYYSQEGHNGLLVWIPFNEGLNPDLSLYWKNRCYPSDTLALNSTGTKLYLIIHNHVFTRDIHDVVPKKIVEFTIGDPVCLSNGNKVTMETAPVIKSSRTFLPIRYVAESLGAKVGWDGKERKVSISLDEIKIELWIGNNIARVNGILLPIDADNDTIIPYIVPSAGRTMLPLRFISENLGAAVYWEGKTKKVTIAYPKG